MLKKDIAGLFNSLMRYGVKPPCDTRDKEAQHKLVNDYFEKLQYISDAEFREVMERAPQIPHWPSIAELEEIVQNYRRVQIENQPYDQKRKREKELLAILGHLPPLGESWVDAMAKKAAKRHFPDASKEFVKEYKISLSTQCMQDYVCDTCYGKSIHECVTGGHQPFLMIEPTSGLLYECVDCEQCSKVIIPTSDEKEERKNGRRQEG